MGTRAADALCEPQTETLGRVGPLRSFVFGLTAALLLAPTAAFADDSSDTEAVLEVDTVVDAIGPVDVRVGLSGYRVRLDHAQVEAIVDMGDYAELAAQWSGSELAAHAVWLTRLQLRAICAAGGHAGVEVSGGWTDVPSISLRE